MEETMEEDTGYGSAARQRAIAEWASEPRPVETFINADGYREVVLPPYLQTVFVRKEYPPGIPLVVYPPPRYPPYKMALKGTLDDEGNAWFRSPLVFNKPSSTKISPPHMDWFKGTWHVTHSTLPMWKKYRNVTITYKPLGTTHTSKSVDPPVRLIDHVAYQALDSDKIKKVKGIDHEAGLGAFKWRGDGWLCIATSHWEILGWAGETPDHIDGVPDRFPQEEQWAVTWFDKTLFTPAGLDIYSRLKEGLSEATMEKIMKGLSEVDDERIVNLAKQLYLVKSDHRS